MANEAPVTPALDTASTSDVAVTSTPVSDATKVVTPSVDATTTDNATPTSEPETPNTGKNRAEERIQGLVAERNAAKEYAEYWREAALRGIRQPEQQQPVQQAKPANSSPPTLEQFGYDQSKFTQAQAAWLDRQVEVKVQRALEDRQSEQMQQDVVQKFEQQAEVFKQDHPDFDIVMANPRLPQLDKIAAAMILSSDHSAAISYALGKNPDLAVRISRMSAPKQALEIGKLENEIRTPRQENPQVVTQSAPRATTRAPAPLEPVPAGGAAEPNPSTMSVNDWMKFRSGEVKINRRGGRLA